MATISGFYIHPSVDKATETLLRRAIKNHFKWYEADTPGKQILIFVQEMLPADIRTYLSNLGLLSNNTDTEEAAKWVLCILTRTNSHLSIDLTNAGIPQFQANGASETVIKGQLTTTQTRLQNGPKKS